MPSWQKNKKFGEFKASEAFVIKLSGMIIPALDPSLY